MVINLKKLLVSLLSILLVLVPFFSHFQITLAASIVVNTPTDELNSDGDCSLREAIQAANTDSAVDACTMGSGTDVITVPAGTYTLSLAGAGENANLTGDLDITSNLTINGAGNFATIIDGNGTDRVVEVRPGATTLIRDITIQNGNSSGILNRGTLTLRNSTVTNNSISGFGGGGVFNTATGTLTVIDSTLSNNLANSPDLSHGGGGIYSDGTVTLNRTTVKDNTTIGRGGGIYNQDPTITIINSTISGNTALNGGGIFNRFGTVQLTHSTITDNTATDNGGGVWNFGGTMRLRNTIVGVNMAVTASDDCAGTMTSQGYNLASDVSCSLGGTGDQNSTNPMLGPLANNGGSTWTHLPAYGSPAIDSVPNASCPVSTDQRGVSRPQGPACDRGSVEVEPTLPSECPGVIGNYNLIQGTNGPDNLNGTASMDLIFGYGGNDKINGKADDDCLVGGLGVDTINGGSGNDVIFGENGNDKLNGDSGNDTIFGGNDNDTMTGGSGNDSLTGEAGASDSANGNTGTDTCNAETETSCEI